MVPVDIQNCKPVLSFPLVPSVLPAIDGKANVVLKRVGVVVSANVRPVIGVTAVDGDPPEPNSWKTDKPSCSVPTAHHAQNDSVTVLPDRRLTPSIRCMISVNELPAALPVKAMAR